MGIKHFFPWFKKKFANSIHRLKKDQFMEKDIDNLMIDMNGIFHNSAQKIYEYGNFKVPDRLLGKKRQVVYKSLEKQIEVFNDICKSVDKILNIVKPKKKLILCVDGPAPLSKQNQQRQRHLNARIHRLFRSFRNINGIIART